MSERLAPGHLARCLIRLSFGVATIRSFAWITLSAAMTAALVVHSSVANGDEAAARAAPLTWDRCVELVLANNAEIQSATRSWEASLEQIKIARGGFFPQVNAQLGYARDGIAQPGTQLGAFANTGWLATLSASQNLFAGFGDVARIRQAEASARASLASLRAIKASVGYDLTVAFEGMVYAKAYRKLTLEIMRRRQENMRLVDLRFQSGRENKGSVLLSEAYFAQAKLDDLQADNALQVARAQLARALGLDTGFVDDVTGEVPISEKPAALAVEELRRLAIETPEYEQSLAQAEAAERASDVARAPYFPSLNLSASAGRLGPDFFPNERDRWNLGITMSYPLFNAGRDSAGLRAAQSAEAAAEASRLNASRLALSRLVQARANFREAVLRFEVDESFRKAAGVRAEIGRKRYNNGLMSFDDWDVIENDLISREKAYLQSRRDRVLAEASWLQAQGKGVFP